LYFGLWMRFQIGLTTCGSLSGCSCCWFFSMCGLEPLSVPNFRQFCLYTRLRRSGAKVSGFYYKTNDILINLDPIVGYTAPNLITKITIH
jgi:hypothetical protein